MIPHDEQVIPTLASGKQLGQVFEEEMKMKEENSDENLKSEPLGQH